MRITYRSRDSKEYWAARWESIPADAVMENEDVYPLKHARKAIGDSLGPVLEAGCGAGRVLRYFHAQGKDIVGFDYIAVAVEKLRAADPSLRVDVGDITSMSYPDEAFEVALAFGLYHGIETGLDNALSETFRVLAKGGVVCASFRADNFQNRMVDWLQDLQAGRTAKPNRRLFHKLNLTKGELRELFERYGFIVENIEPVENMPILYKFKPFRAVNHKNFDENRARKEGYQLNRVGDYIQKKLIKFFPDQFCNVYVLFGRK